eukprot:scaffold70400_cov54-Attheya_sp.AAC.2
MAPLDDLFDDRLTFYTHRRAAVSPRHEDDCSNNVAYASVICSWSVALPEAFFLSVCSFFAVGMNSHGAWGFFYFWGMFSLAAQCGTAISRILAYSFSSKDVAQSLGPAVLLLFILGAGYSPQYLQLPSWLRWLAWISPCAYCYEGVMINEMMGRNVGDINGSVWAQDNLGIPRIPYESAPSGMNTEGLLMGFDAYMLVILTIVFDVWGCVLLHHSQKWFGPTSKRYQVAAGMSLAAPPWYGSRQKHVGSSLVLEQYNDEANLIPGAPSAHLTVKDIFYEVDVLVETAEPTPEKVSKADGRMTQAEDDYDQFWRDGASHDIPMTARDYGQVGKGAASEWVIKRRLGEDALSGSASSSVTTSFQSSEKFLKLDPPEPGRLRLLSGITASFEPGTMSALMGSSGAGKDVLAGYKTGGHILGNININGRPKTDATWRTIAGYCEQVDLHNPALTVRESLIFAARMRLRPFSLPDDARVGFATQIIATLELDEFADMLVGDEAVGQGLPKHARKRLTVGVELAANPSILFADEPTSGLDSLSASVVVSCLKRAAEQQRLTIICTIHQPSREVFAAFDNLLLLRAGGVCVYNGKIANLDTYMQSASGGDAYTMQTDINPADHILDVFCGPLGEDEDWGQLYLNSDMAQEALLSYTSCSCDPCSSGGSSVDTKPNDFGSELWNLVQRQILAHWRTPTYMAVRFWWTVIGNLMVGLVYFQVADSSTESATDTIGAVFFYVNIATVPLLSAVVPLILERAVYYREVTSGTYRRMVYGVAVQLAEIPFNLGFAIVSFVIFYYMVGLNSDAGRTIYFVLMALATYWVLPAFGQLFAFVSPNIGAAVGIGSLLLTLFTLTMGFLITASEIPGWYIWIYWINPLRYILQGMVVNEIGGDETGDMLLSTLSWSYSDRWWYCFVIVLLFGAATGVGIVISTRISWLQR